MHSPWHNSALFDERRIKTLTLVTPRLQCPMQRLDLFYFIFQVCWQMSPRITVFSWKHLPPIEPSPERQLRAGKPGTSPASH